MCQRIAVTPEGFIEHAPVLTPKQTDESGEGRFEDARRLGALRRYGVLDAPPEERLSRITRLAGTHFDASAAVFFVDVERQRPASCYGLALEASPREMSFGDHTIRHARPTVVEDALQDERFAAAPLVASSPGVRFFAGVPLVTPEGQALGALAVVDTRPRTFGAAEQARLADFAALVMNELELHRRQKEDRRRTGEGERSEWKLSEDLVSKLPGVFYLLDAEGRIVQWNDRLEGMSGYETHEIRDMHARELVPAPHHGRVEAALREALATGSMQVETDFVARDGTVTPLLCYGQRVSIDGQPYLIGLGVGVAERREAQQALRESEERHRALVSHASDVMTILDLDGTIRYESLSLKKVLGRAPGDLQGQNAFETIHPEDREEFSAAMAKLRSAPGTTITKRFRVRRTDGSWAHLEAIARNLVDDPAIAGIVVNSRDVTDSLRFEAEREARKRAEELLAAKTALLNNMSHELRTPLTSILGFADVLANEASGEQKKFASCIAENGQRLKATLESVLSLAEMDARGTGLNVSPMSLASAARRAAAAHRLTAEEKGLAFGIETPASPGADGADATFALVDEGALQRVLDNLIGNAIKFTKAGGRVAVRVEAHAGEVRLHVEDTGVGISEAFQASGLFEDFRQESTGLSRSHEGSGLGLAIVRRLVERMDGSIEVDSTKGEGSTFTVRFPRARAGSPDEGNSSGA